LSAVPLAICGDEPPTDGHPAWLAATAVAAAPTPPGQVQPEGHAWHMKESGAFAFEEVMAGIGTRNCPEAHDSEPAPCPDVMVWRPEKV